MIDCGCEFSNADRLGVGARRFVLGAFNLHQAPFNLVKQFTPGLIAVSSQNPTVYHLVEQDRKANNQSDYENVNRSNWIEWPIHHQNSPD
jgi:hypothetical protein